MYITQSMALNILEVLEGKQEGWYKEHAIACLEEKLQEEKEKRMKKYLPYFVDIERYLQNNGEATAKDLLWELPVFHKTSINLVISVLKIMERENIVDYKKIGNKKKVTTIYFLKKEGGVNV